MNPISHSFPVLVIALFSGHALCDYPLQGDFLAKGKNRHAPIPGIPWWQCLTAHALIHAGMVLLVTGSVLYAAIELVAHWFTDFSKCEGWFGFNVDQAIHFGFKLVFALLVAGLR